MKCQFKGTYEFTCDEDSWQDSDYCVLHTNFPDDKTSNAYDILLNEKKKEFDKKVKNNDFHFEGAILNEINLSGTVIENGVNFSEAMILGDVNFNGSTIHGNVFFNSLFKIKSNYTILANL